MAVGDRVVIEAGWGGKGGKFPEDFHRFEKDTPAVVTNEPAGSDCYVRVDGFPYKFKVCKTGLKTQAKDADLQPVPVDEFPHRVNCPANNGDRCTCGAQEAAIKKVRGKDATVPCPQCVRWEDKSSCPMCGGSGRQRVRTGDAGVTEVYKGWTIRQEGGYTHIYPPKGSPQPPCACGSIEQARRIIDRRVSGEATGYQKVMDAKSPFAKMAAAMSPAQRMQSLASLRASGSITPALKAELEAYERQHGAINPYARDVRRTRMHRALDRAIDRKAAKDVIGSTRHTYVPTSRGAEGVCKVCGGKYDAPQHSNPARDSAKTPYTIYDNKTQKAVAGPIEDLQKARYQLKVLQDNLDNPEGRYSIMQHPSASV